MSEPTTTDLFYSLFRGNRSFYVKHQPPFTKNEGTGKVTGSWVGVAKIDGEIDPVSKEKYKEHLTGGDGIAIEPLCEDNTCFLSVIDIDVIGQNYTYIVQRLYSYGLKFVPFVSKSRGLHIYFFYKDKETGKDSIAALQRVVEIFGLGRLFTSDKGKSKVEIFPKHEVLKPGSQGSCLFLPYYNAGNPEECYQKLITIENKVVSISKAIPMIEGLFTSVKEINETLDTLPYSDAPYCIQMCTLTGALGENSGRNDFLFSASVYLKKKQKENFLEELKAMNNTFPSPLEEYQIEDIYKSVMSKDYQYGCKKSPCSEYCDTKLCKKREYGVGKDSGNHFTGFNCWGEISRVMAEEPYYLWKIQVNDGDEFKEIRVDGEADLMNQLVVQRSCLRDLNVAPLKVKDNDWIMLVNTSMAGIKDRLITVERSTDTTEMAALRNYFMRYLTHKQTQNAQAYMVQLGQVFRSDSMYYFTTDGFKDYLRVAKFAIGRTNLREQLISYGCDEGSVTYYVKDGAKVISCWKKADDEELTSLGVFYEDVLEADKVVVEKNKLNKVDAEESFEEDATDDGKYKF